MGEPSIKVRTGAPYPFGATWDGAGVNFAIFSEHATKVELVPVRFCRRCTSGIGALRLARTDGYGLARLPAVDFARASVRIPRPRALRSCLPGIASTPHKVVLDPYAKAVARTVQWAPEMYAYRQDGEDADLSMDEPRQSQPSLLWRQS